MFNSKQGQISFKLILGVSLFLVIATLVILVYVLVQKNFTQAQELHQSINFERARCEQLIASGTSEFGDFAYCERFLKWSENEIN